MATMVHLRTNARGSQGQYLFVKIYYNESFRGSPAYHSIGLPGKERCVVGVNERRVLLDDYISQYQSTEYLKMDITAVVEIFYGFGFKLISVTVDTNRSFTYILIQEHALHADIVNVVTAEAKNLAEDVASVGDSAVIMKEDAA